MFKTLLAKYYQENKERLQKKKLMKDIKIFLKKKEKKNYNMVVNVTKISQKMKKKAGSVQKKILQNEKNALL